MVDSQALRAGEAVTEVAFECRSPTGKCCLAARLRSWVKQLTLPLPTVAVAAVVLAGCASVERSYQANLFLHDIQAKPDDETWLKRTSDEPQRDKITIAINGAENPAWLYRPQATAAGSIVLVPGLSEEGRDDQRLKGFADSLARLGYRVLLPDMSAHGEMRWSDNAIDDIKQVISHMAARQGSQGLPLGAVAMSAMGGPTLLAVAENKLQGEVEFVTLIGSYFDLKAWLEFITTGYDSLADSHDLSPVDGVRWQLLQQLVHWGGTAEDNHWLNQIARRRLANPEASIDVERNALSNQAAVLVDLLVNDQHAEFAELYQQLPGLYKQKLAELDLAGRDWSDFRPDLLLVHGTRDRIIPLSHSAALSDAVPEAKLYRITGLSHTELDLARFDSLRLWRAAAAILEYRAQ